LLAVVHKSVVAQAEEVLATCSFATCPYTGEESGKQIYDELCAERERVKNDLEQNQIQMYALKDEVKNLKVYCDNIAFEREKVQLGEKLLTTQKTFLLEAYVPSGAEQSVGEALDDVTSAIYYEFSDVPADEMPPTLMRNNKVLSNFETITNMYSPPNARELDPTTIMSFFYSLFLGFIMGDAGYGILMLVGGWLLYKKSSPHSGIKSLAGVFAIGGIFAIVWGLLFNSVFGLSLPFLPTLMPDAQSDMWSLAGIKVPAVLVISLIIGTVQLFAGYVCSAVQSFRRGKILDGICGGLTWAVFSVGVILAIIGFVEEANADMLVQVGAIIAAVGLVAAILTAGRGQKFFAKFTKGFGAAYGVINYASDVLSYARLYGLMLSGAVIAKIVSQYSVQFMTSGNFALIILGIVLMLAGHLFNLAMSLLSAYIHDARLQYVEFYGRFFEGEGELFAPLGSSHKYIYIQ
jgi:V/A-type H+-transporting ATPase subunit I